MAKVTELTSLTTAINSSTSEDKKNTTTVSNDKIK